MTQIIPMRRAQDTDEDLIEELTPDEQAVKVLEAEFPRLCNDIAMLVRRPFRLHWDPTTLTASTDCKAEIFLAPWFFLEGKTEIGYGTVYHEAGHILWSSYGTDLLDQAQRIGGDTLSYIMNIVLDRKDDMLTAGEAPGFAPALRNRLAYICTMTRRQLLEEVLARQEEAGQKQEAEREINPRLEQLRKKRKKKKTQEAGLSREQEITKILKRFKPNDPYEDFFFAAKWHKKPRLKVTRKAMKYLKSRRLLKASPAELLWICQKVQEILRKGSGAEREKNEMRFKTLALIALSIGGKTNSRKIKPEVARVLTHMVKQYVGTVRSSGLNRLLQRLKGMPMIHPGPLSVGRKEQVPVRKVKQDQRYNSAYQRYLSEVQSLVEPLMRTLKRLDNPSEFTIYGQDEGELDLSESARIATGLNGYYQDTVTERNIDAELHLAIDCSGSMTGDKIEQAKQIAAVFTEATLSLGDNLKGYVWAFSSEAIYDFGPSSRSSGFVTAEGEAGNSDTHMLVHVGKALAKSPKRRKVLLVLCDDGPDNMEMAKQLSRQLLARGIVVVHLLVGVHGTPDIYPFELIYTSMQECLEEFGNLLEKIIKHLE